MSKMIRIECTGADLLELDELTEFQGDLKDLSEESYGKLKASILTLGFSFPVAAWKSGQKNFILDAHQRVAVLKRLRDEEGYLVPPLPVVWIKAKNRKEAAKKLLAVTSQYGEVTNEGLKGFLTEFDLSVGDIMEGVQFPEIDLDLFGEANFGSKEVSFTAKTGAKELDASDFDNFQHECPKCKFGWND